MDYITQTRITFVEAPAMAVLLFCTAAYVFHLVFDLFAGRTGAQKQPHMLHLRKIQFPNDGDMIGGSEIPHNPFTEEVNFLADFINPFLDIAVMRALDGKFGLLVKQEHLHAKMHKEGAQQRAKQGEHGERWQWFVNIGKQLLLHSGEQISWGLMGNVESAIGMAYYYSNISPFTRGYLSNDMLFHIMEELEHAPLTTGFLGTKVWTLTPILTFPIMVVIYFVLFLVPPIIVLSRNLWLLLRPRAYVDLVLYYLTFVPTFLAVNGLAFMYWVLPFCESSSGHASRLEHMKVLVEKRGIKIDVVGEETYSVVEETKD